ncbi:MAG: hypothetical protein JWM02_3014 [Frankiales bacterium]|nr:hypothetical protein [Frankiales bacterium]
MARRRRAARWAGGLTRTTAVLVAAGLLVILTSGTAAAHAQLVASDPAPGAVLPRPPTAVTLTFGDPIQVGDGTIEVFDDEYNRVDAGGVTSAGRRDALHVGLRLGLAAGTYTVNWHASSADTHPASGSFQFSVDHTSVVRGAVPAAGRNDSAGALLGLLRWLGYLGLLLGPGVLLVVLGLWPAGLADRRTGRLTLAGLGLLVISTLGAMVLQGVYASGEPFSTLWTSPEKLDTHSRRFDEVYAVRSFLLIGVAVALMLARWSSTLVPTRPRRLLLGATAVSTVALLATWPLVGHSAAGGGSAVAVAVNLVHTLAMTVWLGGLVVVLVCLRPSAHAADLAMVLPRFSRLALTAVAALVVTGSFMVWREVGSVGALTDTRYGRLLLVKLCGVVVLLLLGNHARRWVKRHVHAETSPSRPATDLHRRLLAETTIALAVLAATAALVVIVPARQDFAAPFRRSLSTSDWRILVEIPSPRRGDASMRVTLMRPDGSGGRITGLNGSTSLAGADARLTPLHVKPMSYDGLPRPVEAALAFTAAGNWIVRLHVKNSPTESVAVSVLVPVG